METLNEHLKKYPAWKDISLSEAVKEYVQELDSGGHMLGVPQLDSLLSGVLLDNGKVYEGLNYGSAIVVSARPGFGKTLFLAKLVEQFLRRREHVLVMGYEMGTTATAGYLAKLGVEDSPYFHAPKKTVKYDIEWLKHGVTLYLENDIPLKAVMIDHWNCLVDVSANGALKQRKETQDVIDWFKERRITMLIAVHETEGAEDEGGRHYGSDGLKQSVDLSIRLFNVIDKSTGDIQRTLTVDKNRKFGKVKKFPEFSLSRRGELF